jgi:predicted metalloprotease
LGFNPGKFVRGGGAPPPPARQQQGGAPDEEKQFVATVLAETEDTWNAQFQARGATYQPPTLVLFSGVDQSGCGTAQSAMGPFYCPRDGKVYLDLSFFQDLRQRFNAPGEFAEAYVVAHEVGHHVQNLLGITDRAEQMGRQQGASGVSVRIELQADCFAGIWANHTKSQGTVVEPGDVEAALNAATAIGDDRLQQETQGRVVPDAFTHGTSAQRVRWFQRGLQSGEVKACDTFGASSL